MQSLRRFGDWLKEGTKFPWGKLAEQGIAATKATADLSKTWKEATPKLAKLENVDQLNSFFKLFESPVTQLAVSGLPFASVGIGLLRLYWDVTKDKPEFESSVMIVAQMAYLESLRRVIVTRTNTTIPVKLECVRLSDLFERQLKKLESIELSRQEALSTLTGFPQSALAAILNGELMEALMQSGMTVDEVRSLVEQVCWGTYQDIHIAAALLHEDVPDLLSYLSSGGRQVQERYESIEQYLKEYIDPLPDKVVFHENNPRLTFRDIYVPLSIRRLNKSGEETVSQPLNVDDWMNNVLMDQGRTRNVIFIQGEAGRGKSVFCRMLASQVREQLPSAWNPILICLRDIREIKDTLAKTLEIQLQNQDFVQSDSGWLTDSNIRFLLIFDGFDELLLQRREGGGLKDFLHHISKFQETSQHQCIVTGRPLALQGIDKELKRIDNLERVRLEPMTDAQRTQWLYQWGQKFGSEKALAFCDFLAACPSDIDNNLAREPLLLYMLGRLHREKPDDFNAQMFAGAKGIQAKVRVYDESIKWVLDKQREDENIRLTGLEEEELREVLQEAALCVAQSEGETAQLSMLSKRFTDAGNPVFARLKQARDETKQEDDKALNNLLTTFYLQPGKQNRTGSVEFAHKSFGEFLFAERLKAAFDVWVEVDDRKKLCMDSAAVEWQIYDLLGYGPLTSEIFEYLGEIAFPKGICEEIYVVPLRQRLHEFYESWCKGFYIDAIPKNNLPQRKMMQLRSPEIMLGLRQTDIYAGLNVMSLLFTLHRYSQVTQNHTIKEKLRFHPCGELNTESFEPKKLASTLDYFKLLGSDSLQEIMAGFFAGADLRSIEINGTALCTSLDEVDLGNSRVNAASLNGGISRTNLTDTQINDVSINGGISNTDFRNSQINDVSINGGISETNFMAAQINNVNINGGISGIDFQGAEIKYLTLNGGMSDVNCAGATLHHVNVMGDAVNIDLDGAEVVSLFVEGSIRWEGAEGAEMAERMPESLKRSLGIL